MSQLKWRLREGGGEAIYEIGVEDSGLLAGNVWEFKNNFFQLFIEVNLSVNLNK